MLLEKSNFKKKVRWDATTRGYQTLYLNDLNQTKEESEEFEKAFSEEHDCSEEDEILALVGGADELLESASFEKIIEYYDDALKKFPDHPVLLYRKGGLLCDADHYEEAIKIMDDILEIDSRYVDALFLKSKILSIIGKTEESEECKDRAEKMKSKGLRL
jgi:tetratricopeptide (TPR) repeat protein